MSYKMIIFDLDGVLVDACEWHRLALNSALYKVSKYKISLEEHYDIFNGIPTKVKLNKLTDMGIIESKDHQLIYDYKQTYTIEMIENEAQIRQEKIDMLNTLSEKGYILTCYTNSIKKTAKLMLEKTGIYHLFAKIITNQDVRKPKPDPEGYNFLMSYYNIDKSETLIIEDSPKGIKAGKDSGANLIIVKDPDEVNIELFKEIL